MHAHDIFLERLQNIANANGQDTDTDTLEHAWDLATLRQGLHANDYPPDDELVWDIVGSAVQETIDVRSIEPHGGDHNDLMDCYSLIHIAKTVGERDITVKEAYLAWTAYSDTHAAGWLALHSDRDETWECLNRFLD